MNSNRNWELRVDEKVFKALKKIPKPEVKKITDTIRALPDNPYAGDIQKVRGEETTWRRRVGEYRIFYEIYQQESRIDVRWVERKGSKTYS